MWIQGNTYNVGDEITIKAKGVEVTGKITAATVNGIYIEGENVDGFFKWTELGEENAYKYE